jgi:hypothetical protein
MKSLIGTLDHFEVDGAGLSALVCSFRFQCALHLAAPFFDVINTVSKLMQKIRSDIGSIGVHVSNFVVLLQDWRDKKNNPGDPFPAKFETVYNEVVDWCIDHDIEIELGRRHSRSSRLKDPDGDTPGECSIVTTI